MFSIGFIERRGGGNQRVPQPLWLWCGHEVAALS